MKLLLLRSGLIVATASLIVGFAISKPAIATDFVTRECEVLCERDCNVAELRCRRSLWLLPGVNRLWCSARHAGCMENCETRCGSLFRL